MGVSGTVDGCTSGRSGVSRSSTVSRSVVHRPAVVCSKSYVRTGQCHDDFQLPEPHTIGNLSGMNGRVEGRG